jgi:N-acylneuraminate cytidylyltransferase/CMP-N,N'-diacetyllegionaminic acid synthase
MRPAELATDEAKGIDAILHAVQWHRDRGENFDLVLVLQPTSPLRTAADIDLAVELFFAKDAGAVVSVCPTDHHPWWSNTLPVDGSMKDFLRPELKNANRQSLPAFYRLNGAIYLADIRFLEKKRSFITDGAFAYPMALESSVDIDTLLDFRLAEILLAERAKHHPK